MPITNQMKVLLFTNRPETVDRMRQTLAANPSAPVWWTLFFSVTIAFSSMSLTHLIQPKSPMVSGWAYLVVSIMLMVVQTLTLLFMNGMATWAMNRQQRKSWGVSLPDEPRILGFRPGIWAGAATSEAVCIGVMLQEVCAALLLPAWHKQIASTSGTVFGVMSLLYFSYAISYFYGIPKRLFVFRYVVLPVVLISIIGIIVAIVMGQYRNYENQKAQSNVHQSAVAHAGMVTPARTLASSPKARRAAMDVYADKIRKLVQANVRMPDSVQMTHAGGTVVITFRLTPSGHLLSAQVAKSSGVVAVNHAALKTVDDIRFPPFTKDMPRHPITFEVSVNLSAQPVTTAPAASLQYAMHPAHTTGQALLAPPSRFGASPLLSSMIRNDDTHCLAGLPMDAPWSPGASVPATVVQFVPRMDVLRDIAWNNRALHGMIASRYLRNQRVLLHPDGSRVGMVMLAVVSAGMRVTIGEHVQMDRYHAFHHAPCTYVPNLIER